MFLFNWFRYPVEKIEESKQIPAQFKNEGEIVVPNIIGQDTTTVTVPKGELDALIDRLKKLEEIINTLPIKILTPTQSQSSSPHSSVSAHASESSPQIPSKKRGSNQTQFQIELEKKLELLRAKMGESHGFADFTPKRIKECSELAETVMTQSIMFAEAIKRSLTPEVDEIPSS